MIQLNLEHPTIISKQNARCPQFLLKYNVLKFNNLTSGREGKVFEETSPVAYIHGQLYIFTTGGLKTNQVPFPFSPRQFNIRLPLNFPLTPAKQYQISFP